jgi:nitrogen regulatory protein PII
MKRIEALIRPTKVATVCAALEGAGHNRLVISQVENRGGSDGTPYQLRGKAYKAGLLINTKVEVIVQDNEADRIIESIRSAAFTGKTGDGEIYVYDMYDVIEIGTRAAT